jgi:hypothetical protein
MKKSKYIIDPRILKNMLTSGYFPHIENWEVALLRNQNRGEKTPTLSIVLWSKGQCLTRKSKTTMELYWVFVYGLCEGFNNTFSMDPRDSDRTYEKMLDHAQTILERLALVIVTQEDMLKRMQGNHHSHVTQVYRQQFGRTYDCAAKLFREDLSKDGYKPFFDRAEGIVSAGKN